MVAIETMQIQQHPFFRELSLQCLVEGKLKHLVAQTAYDFHDSHIFLSICFVPRIRCW